MSQKEDRKALAQNALDKIIGFQDVKSDDSMQKVLLELTNSNNLETKSELDVNQIKAFARAAWFADYYESDSLKILITYLLKFTVSKDRGGRKELVDALKGTWAYQLAKQKNEKIEV